MPDGPSSRYVADPPLDNSPLGLRTSRSCCDRLSKYLVDPRRIVHKYFLLCLICLFIPGPYFHDGLVSTYKAEVMMNLELSNKQFSMLFAFASLTGLCCSPSYIVMAWLGRTRVALGAGLTCAVASLGVTIGFQGRWFGLMLISRVIFWLAVYMLCTVQTVLVYALFRGRELVVAYGLVITFCRLGGVLAYFLSGPLLGLCGGVFGSFMVGVFFVVVAFVATATFACLFRGTSTAQAVRPLLGESRQVKRVSLELVRTLPVPIVLVAVSVGLMYGVIFPFEANADAMLQDAFGYSANGAGFLLTVAPAISLLSPFLAPVMGEAALTRLRYGIAGHLIVSSGMILLSTEAAWSPAPGFIQTGIGYCVGCCGLWTALPVMIQATVPEEHRSTVEHMMTGLCYAAAALSQFVSNLVVGAILDASSYRLACVWLAFCSALGASAAFGAVRGLPRAVQNLQALQGMSGPTVSSLDLGSPTRTPTDSCCLESSESDMQQPPLVCGSSKEVLVQDDHFCNTAKDASPNSSLNTHSVSCV
mmetsp:Transcript_18657/g.33692  ORF Transcript_18657/g.33692 Transcript_18657/m.33692 type:complete len:532 (+) Transcript_18657:33-1628(+)